MRRNLRRTLQIHFDHYAHSPEIQLEGSGGGSVAGGGAAVQLVLCAVTIGVGTFDGDYEAETQRFYHQTYVLVMYCNAM